jgi:flagellar protein FliS
MFEIAVAREPHAVKTESATLGHVAVALYEGCVRCCKAAQEQIRAGETVAKGRSISKAITLVGELRRMIDHSIAPELCDSLERVYAFTHEQLSLANINKDADLITPVVRILGNLADAWSTAVLRRERADTHR